MARSTTSTTDDNLEGKTEIWHGYREAVDKSLEVLSKAKIGYEICMSKDGPAIIIEDGPMRNACLGLKNRGGYIKLITEITPENVGYCKELVEFLELRHLAGVKGNFGIVDKSTYFDIADTKGEQSASQYILSTTNAFVEQQQYFFDVLWEKASSADLRIKEIEEGIGPEFIETIRDPNKVQQLVTNLLKEAKSEVLVIFSTANAFLRQARAGSFQLLAQKAKDQNMQIRILLPFDDRIKKTVEVLARTFQQQIEMKNVVQPLQTTSSMMVVDRKYSLTAELKDDAKETTPAAIGMVTYSNSTATVMSYASIFESLWDQAELYERYERTRQQYEQLKEYDAAQKEFISIAAHELRTPIQPIIGLTEILNHKESNSSEYGQLVKIINRNANRLNTLIESLLDVARIESQSLRLDREAFNLNNTIRDAIADAEKAVDNKAILSFLCFEDEDIIVNADRGKIIQVISNLLSNAVKFTGQGIVLISLKKESNHNDEGQFAIVSVKDSGSGIDPGIMPKLFTKFASKSEKGTGLGLFISKGIVEAHGGKIWAKNNKPEEGRGATFSFSLPLADKDPN